jgi:putative phage-type endonuclease
VELPGGTILGPYESREAWLEARRLGIGGSDIATILGLSTFTSELEVFYSKVEGRESEANEAMEIGAAIEPWIIDRWLKQNPSYNLLRDLVAIQSNDFPFLLHSPDALGEEYPNGGVYFGVEVKNIRSDHNWDPLPEFYMAQVQHGLLCSGLDRWIVVALVAGQKLITREIEPDKEMQGRIALAAKRFWNTHVLPGVPPEPDGSESAKKALERRWEASEGKCEVDPTLWSVFQAAKGEVDRVDKHYHRIQQRIQQEMGEAEILTFEGKKVASWKVSTRTSIDTKRLREEDSALAKKYEKTVPTRIFRLS